MRAQRQYFIGTSGWSYPQWKDGLYKACPKKNWLSCYAQHFSAVEQNSSFYRLPSENYIERWVQQTPEHFRFAVKAWREITHNKRLRNCKNELDKCLTLFRRFGQRLGPVLFQLPPSMQRDNALLADFLTLLPDDLKIVFEFRHASWLCEPVFEMLEKAHVSLCHSHMKNWQEPRTVTSKLFYARMHGSKDWFKGAYSKEQLEDLAEQIHGLEQVNEAYVFFNNTILDDDAPENALGLSHLLVR